MGVDGQGVWVGVASGVSVGVGDGFGVSVGGMVGVAVGCGVSVGSGVGVAVGTGVLVGAAVGDGVFVGAEACISAVVAGCAMLGGVWVSRGSGAHPWMADVAHSTARMVINHITGLLRGLLT